MRDVLKTMKEMLCLLLISSAVLGAMLFLIFGILTARSCSKLGLTSDTHSTIVFNEDASLTYNNSRYISHDYLHAEIDKESDTQQVVSWTWFWGHFTTYYAPIEKSPLYLQNQYPYETYVREDFDYKAATYRLDGTDATIQYTDIYQNASPINMNGHAVQKLIFLPLDTYDSCGLYVALYTYHETYFISFDTRSHAIGTVAYPASEQFVQMLTEHGIIEAP